MGKIKEEIKEVREKCYIAYQLDWMMSHGWSLKDAFDGVADAFAELAGEREPIVSGRDAAAFMECAMDSFLSERGFGSGSLFACMEEFLTHEYRDPGYMKHLFECMPPDRGEVSRLWKEDTDAV